MDLVNNFSIWFINCNKHSTLMQDVNNKGSHVSMGRRGIWKIYYLLNFSVNLKLIQENKLIKKVT